MGWLVTTENSKLCSRAESGAIIVLFALLLIPLIALIALAIDIGRQAEASSKTKGTVGLASLAGLETYYMTKAPDGVTDPLEIHKFRVRTAIDRIETFMSLSETATIGKVGVPLLAAGSHELKEGSGAIEDRQVDISGTVTPGQWFFSEPGAGCGDWTAPDGSTDSNDCPCQGGSKSWDKPCFRPNSSTEAIVTAFKIDYHTQQTEALSTAVETTFANVLGYENLSYGVSTIAAVAPRALVFSIDNSRSMTFGNFLQKSSTVSYRQAAEYVYPLGSSDSACTGHSNPCVTRADCRFDTDSASYFRAIYYAMLDDGPRGTNLKPSSFHYYDDYECYTFGSQRYLIATKIGYSYDDNSDGVADGLYNGPEPLNGVLQGIYTVAESLEKISVAGDQILLFAFDDQTPDNLVGEKRLVGPTSVGEDDFEDLKRLVKTEGQTDADVRNRIEARFFPAVGSSTDIPGAMAYALDRLSRMGESESLRMHTMFSDGISNCSHRGGTSYADFMVYHSGTKKFSLNSDTCMDSNSDPETPSGSGYMNTVAHSSSGWGNYAYGNHIWSLWEANALASRAANKLDSDLRPVTTVPQKTFLQSGTGLEFKTYEDLGIKFNFVAIGDQGFPHTILRQSKADPTKCMSDSEARVGDDWYNTYDPNYVDDAWALYNSGGVPVPYALATNYMYESAKQTDGFYFAVRKPCSQLTSDVNSSCVVTATGQKVDAYLTAQCAASHYESWPDSSSCWGSWPSSNHLVYDRPFTDNCGRLKCDAQCRDVGEQVEAAMLQMLSQNPFVLVSELN